MGAVTSGGDEPTYSPGITLEQIEREAILAALRHFRGNRTATARALGISARTLTTRIKDYKDCGYDVPPPPELSR